MFAAGVRTRQLQGRPPIAARSVAPPLQIGDLELLQILYSLRQRARCGAQEGETFSWAESSAKRSKIYNRVCNATRLPHVLVHESLVLAMWLLHRHFAYQPSD